MTMARNRILLVDDDPLVRFAVRDFLESHGMQVTEAESVQQAEEKFRGASPDAAIVDFSLPDGDGLELLEHFKSADPEMPVIVLTGQGSIEAAVRAIKLGAEQFLIKPVELPALHTLLVRALENKRYRQHSLVNLSKAKRERLDPFLGTSGSIRKLQELARRVVSSDSPILIQGETGSGKGVLAKWIHENSPRAEEVFIDLNCAGLEREFLETELFGHERGAFTGAVHSKLGLHRDLKELVRQQRFREDLFFRITIIPIRLPPLRERQEDIPLLACEILRRISQQRGRDKIELDDAAMIMLTHYLWPGNIREMRNVLERAAQIAERSPLTVKDLELQWPGSTSATPASTVDTNLTMRELELRYIGLVLAEEKGSIDRAAERLGISRSSLYSKVKNKEVERAVS